MAAFSSLSKTPMQEILADRNLMQEVKVYLSALPQVYMHYDSINLSNLLIWYSACFTEEEEKWTKYVESYI